MRDWLTDLFQHQEWADAEHWRAIRDHPAASADSAIGARLHHIHLVQRSFLSVCRGEQPERPSLESFGGMDQLCAYARSYHEDVRPWLADITPDRLQQSVSIRWFKDPPLQLPVSQALTQAVMHSHYHRGQNASRLRELGGEPPMTDFIVWLWKGQPSSTWPAATE